MGRTLVIEHAPHFEDNRRSAAVLITRTAPLTTPNRVKRFSMATNKTIPPCVIYALCDPRDGAVRYIGWSVNAGRRLNNHICEALTIRAVSHKGRWIRSLDRLGLRPQLMILEVVQKADALAREVAWIKEFRSRGARLTNLTDGGEVPPHGWNRGHTKETDPRVARAAEGLRRAMQGNRHGVGTHRTAEQKDKIRQAQLRSWVNDPARRDMWKRNPHPSKGKASWLKGLTKETDPRIAAIAINNSASHLGQTQWNKGLTKEADARIAGRTSASFKPGGVPWNKQKLS
jgi:hypothetical protein